MYARLVAPIMVLRQFELGNKHFLGAQAGINLNYSGFYRDDEGIQMSVGDTNNRQIPVFNGSFKSNNYNKPWVSFSLGGFKNFTLKNENVITLRLLFEFSWTNFIKGEYVITIPNKPVTRGTYSSTGSCIGLGLQYWFTGANNKFVREYERKQRSKTW
jgi:hypothetical protein